MKKATCFLLITALCGILAACSQPEIQISSGGRMEVMTEEEIEGPAPEPTGEKIADGSGGGEETEEPQETPLPEPSPNPVTQEEELNTVVFEGEGLTVILRRFTFAADHQAVFTYDVVSNAPEELTCSLKLNSANCYSLANQTIEGFCTESHNDTWTVSPGTSVTLEAQYCLRDPGTRKIGMTHFDHFSVNTVVTRKHPDGWDETLADEITYVEVTGAPDPDYLNPEGDILYTDDLLTVTSLGYESETKLLYVYLGFRNEGKDDTICIFPGVNGTTWQSKFFLMEEYDIRVNCCKMAILALDMKPMMDQLGVEQPSSLQLAINFYGQRWQPVTLSVPLESPAPAMAYPWAENPIGETADLSLFYYTRILREGGDADLITFCAVNNTQEEFLISLKDGDYTVDGQLYSAWGYAVLRPGMATVFSVEIHHKDDSPAANVTGNASFIFDYSPQVKGETYYSGARYSGTITIPVE
ncbi:MAG: hypothetical protein ACOX17_02920 [Christensenellales bacterium]